MASCDPGAVDRTTRTPMISGGGPQSASAQSTAVSPSSSAPLSQSSVGARTHEELVAQSVSSQSTDVSPSLSKSSAQAISDDDTMCPAQSSWAGGGTPRPGNGDERISLPCVRPRPRPDGSMNSM